VTTANFELGKLAPYARTVTDLRSPIEAAGVEFIPENGTRRPGIDCGIGPTHLRAFRIRADAN
jgi:hypothetical protein